MNKRNKGISLIVLVITIIIILILATAIILTLVQSGIIDKAQEAVDKNNQVAQDELNVLDKLNELIKKETNNKPTIKRFGVVAKTINSLSIEATATDGDNEKMVYKLYVGTSKEDLAQQSLINEGVNGEVVTWNIENLEEYTKYYYKLEVSDGISTVTSAIKEVMTNRMNTSPTVANLQIESKTTNSIKLKASATDAEDDKLTYTIYLGETEDNLTKQITMEEQNKGEGVTFEKIDLDEYTLYYYRVDVSDEWDTTEGIVQEVRTYCPGNGSICEGKTTCTHCNDNGKCTKKEKSSTTTTGYEECTLYGGTKKHTIITYWCSCRGRSYPTRRREKMYKWRFAL